MRKRSPAKSRRFVAAGARANFHDDVFLVVGIFGQQQELELALNDLFARRKLLFFVVRQLLHFRIVGFEKHLVRAGQILFDLLVLAMLGHDFRKFRVLLGDFLEPRRIRNELLRRKLLRQFVVPRAQLIQFFRECENGHCNSS